MVGSDRWWAYRGFDPARRQLCWSHLIRDFAAHSEGLAAQKEFGERGLDIAQRLFCAWDRFQADGDRRRLKRKVAPLKRELRALLRRGSQGKRHKLVRGSPPSDKKLLIGATTSLGIWVSVVGPEEVDAPEVAVSSPPFVALLADASDDPRVRYTDTAEWLREDAHARREVNLFLPVVRGLESLDQLTLVTYEELVG